MRKKKQVHVLCFVFETHYMFRKWSYCLCFCFRKPR